MEDELRRRGYSDPRSPSFGESAYNRRLEESRWGSFLLLPTSPLGTASTNREGWLQWLDPDKRRYEPELNGIYVPHALPRPVLGGVAGLKPAFVDGRMTTNLLDAYLRVGFDGSVEYGFAPVGEVTLSSEQTVPYFRGKEILVRLWQTLGVTAELRARLSMATPHLLSVNLTSTEGTILGNFARGWPDPTNDLLKLQEAPRCLEPNVQVRREFRAEDFEEVSAGTASEPPRQVRELSSDVCFAFGISEPVLVAQR